MSNSFGAEFASSCKRAWDCPESIISYDGNVSILHGIRRPRTEDYTFVAAIPGSHIESIIFEEGIIL
eukprot:CCRYP_015910-RB/>CCRYP_015910-RB protein AED:0.33 eAED:0.37 QI:0/0.5/0.66/1/0/0.33/3/1540/66